MPYILETQALPATPAQCHLIDELQDKGAPIPSKDGGDPDFTMLESLAAADDYIKEWGHLLRRTHSTSTRADRWGGVMNT